MDRTLIDKYFSSVAASAREERLREHGYARYLDSVFLQRLRGVSFLGVLDFVYELQRPSNRYDHTVCVSELALELSQRLQLSKPMERAFVIANLLHDVGHAAFSHNSEPFLLERLNLYHQGLLSAFFIRSNRFAPNGTSLSALVSAESSDVTEAVTGLILQSREATPLLQVLFDCPLNCDKIEGNHRTLSHLGRPSIGSERIMDLFELRNGDVFLDAQGIDLIVDFWTKERDVYWTDIYTSEVFAAEAMLTRALEVYFEGPGQAEAFLFMTDDEAIAAIEECEGASELVQRLRTNQLFSSLKDTHPDVFESFETRLKEHRFDNAIRGEIENEIADALGITSDQVISHFSRRKHFASNFADLKQLELFDVYPELMPIDRVVSAFKNSKRSGDFQDVFWVR